MNSKNQNISSNYPELLIAKDYFPFGMEMTGRYDINNPDPGEKYRYGFNSMEKDDEWTGQTGSHLDFGARIYDARIGRWLSLDPLASKYPSLSPYNFVANNPIVLIDKDGREIYALSEEAKNVIINSISPEDAKFIKFDDKGKLDKALLNTADSESINLMKLQQLANDNRIFEVSVAGGFKYKDEKGVIIPVKMNPVEIDESFLGYLYSLSTAEIGFQGVTQTPGDEPNKYNSPNETIRIIINISLSEQGQAETFAHEAYGHAYLYSIGKKHIHIFKSIEEGGETDVNIPLKESIIESQKEVQQYYENKK